MPAHSELSLLLAVTALAWQVPLKYGYEFPASKNTQTSNFKAKDTNNSILRNVGMCKCYNIISQNTVILIFTAVRTSDLWNRIPLKKRNLCKKFQLILLNSTFRCLLHNSQPYGHILSYYLSYNLTSPNMYPCVINTVSFLHSSFVVIFLDIFLIPGKCFTCFTHQSRFINIISSVTYDKCCRLTSAR
jgi:hypothetical protein